MVKSLQLSLPSRTPYSSFLVPRELKPTQAETLFWRQETGGVIKHIGCWCRLGLSEDIEILTHSVCNLLFHRDPLTDRFCLTVCWSFLAIHLLYGPFPWHIIKRPLGTFKVELKLFQFQLKDSPTWSVTRGKQHSPLHVRARSSAGSASEICRTTYLCRVCPQVVSLYHLVNCRPIAHFM